MTDNVLFRCLTAAQLVITSTSRLIRMGHKMRYPITERPFGYRICSGRQACIVITVGKYGLCRFIWMSKWCNFDR